MKNLITLLMLTSSMRASANTQLIVWNVGQGLWSTVVETSSCHHFDAGGERFPLKPVLHACGERQNVFHFSHWDWDHVSFAKAISRRFRRECLEHAPGGTAPRGRTEVLSALPTCEMKTRIAEIGKKSDRHEKGANDQSRVFLTESGILFPGDASKSSEKTWQSEQLSKIRILIAGHHGSRTSTSESLLRKLPRLKIAISSARKLKYGHPHSQVVDRLQSHGVALLRTEEWGHIRIEMNSSDERSHR